MSNRALKLASMTALVGLFGLSSAMADDRLPHRTTEHTPEQKAEQRAEQRAEGRVEHRVEQGTEHKANAQRPYQVASSAPMTRSTTDPVQDDGSDQPLSDTWITTKVKSKLLADSVVPGTAISVTTTNGVVTLESDLTAQAEIDRVIMLAQQTEGVVGVTHTYAQDDADQR